MNNSKMRYNLRRTAIPSCRDPFINNLLMPIGQAPGEPQRFWITSWNTIDGCTGALVDETGTFRLYHFRKPLRSGFYSVAAEDPDTLWLWGDLNEVVRLSLGSGKYECFPTGGPNGLVFHGMAYDRTTGKLLAEANTYSGSGPTAISFDTNKRQTARIYEHVAEDHYLHGHFANGDGTYTVLTEIPGTSLLRWDPRAETIRVERLREREDIDHEMEDGSHYRLVQDKDGRVYFPRRGWFDPRQQRFDKKGPKPDKEMTWFAQYENGIVGVASADGDTTVGLWDLSSGKVRQTACFTDSPLLNINLTQDGKLVCVSMYGEFTRHDLQTGRLEISRLLPAVGVQHTDCLRLIDKGRLLGTPFITQRFWEVNLKTGRGCDCGRAAPSAGEILQTWCMGGKIYMASYVGGRLVEYDPQVHPHFPENPRVVADPPESNRPVAATDDGRCLYYACSAPYGKLGSTLTCYDTKTGASLSKVNPIADQRIVSLAYDRAGKRLLATAHFDADCCSCTPSSNKCYVASLSAADLNVLEQFETPAGTSDIHILGPVRRGKWLCRLNGTFAGFEAAAILLEIGGTPLTMAALDTARPVPADWQTICPLGKLGHFAVQVGQHIERWDLARYVRLEVISAKAEKRRLLTDGDTLFLLGERDILILNSAAESRKKDKKSPKKLKGKMEKTA